MGTKPTPTPADRGRFGRLGLLDSEHDAPVFEKARAVAAGRATFTPHEIGRLHAIMFCLA